MSEWAAQVERLERALDRLETAIADRDGRYAAHAAAVAEATRRQTAAELESELREETQAVAERIDVVVRRIESLLKTSS